MFLEEQTIEDRFVPRDDGCFTAQGRQRKVDVIANPEPLRGICMKEAPTGAMLTLV